MGMMGAAWATVIAYVVMMATTLVVSQRVYPIPYEWGRITKVLVAAILLGALKDFLPDAGLALTLAMKTVLLLLYPVALYVLGFYQGRELTWIRGRFVALSHGLARG
jgi:Na+-driven multidrug efflux pump